MGVGASVVNVNVGGRERARLEGGLFSRIVVGTRVKRVGALVDHCLMIQTHWTISLSSNQRRPSNFLALEHRA